MSIAFWRKEFYPIPVNKKTHKRTWLQCTYHSLKKWLGLSPENLAKHELVRRGKTIYEQNLDTLASARAVTWQFNTKNSLYIDDKSCALCAKNNQTEELNCNRCPLFHIRGKVQCDLSTKTEKLAPYMDWMAIGNAESMIYWLKRTQRFLLKKQGNRRIKSKEYDND